MLLLSSLQLKKTIAIASSAMKTRLSIDTHFETYRAIIARTKNFISDDDFIVHRGDINNPDILIMGSSREETIDHVRITINLLQSVGFLISWEKSVLFPS
jgi:hypothetical protein